MTPLHAHITTNRPAGPIHGGVRALLLAALLLLGATAGQPASAAEMGEAAEERIAPPLALNDMHGKPHDLAEYRGKVVLVNFWASWCYPCLQEIPDLIKLAEALEDKPFVLLAVNVGEEKEKFGGYIRKMDQHMVILMDSESKTFERWKGIGLPSTFVLDPSGSIRYEAYGPVDWDRQDVVAALTALMAKPANGEAGKQK